jgi:hypothetical protein
MGISKLLSMSTPTSSQRGISMFVSNEMINPNTGVVDPKHMLGTSNFDVFRWPSLENGTQRGAFATFITTLVVPGVPLVLFLGYRLILAHN